MKLSKLVLIAAMAFGAVSVAQAAPDTAKIAAKLQASSAVTTQWLPPVLEGKTQEELKAYYKSLPVARQIALKEAFKEAPAPVRKTLWRWWKQLDTSVS